MSAYKINVENSPVNVGQTRRGSLLESPDAYKDMAVILENIKETVDVIEIVKPVYNFKAGGECAFLPTASTFAFLGIYLYLLIPYMKY